MARTPQPMAEGRKLTAEEALALALYKHVVR
jgi:hypothetical protein